MTFVVGIDEAGRGPLAGPVSVGVVAVEEGFDLLAAFPGLNDSKKLSEKRREKLFELLEQEVALGRVRYAVEFGSSEEIDRDGISPTIKAALARGLEKLLPEPGTGKVWLDGSLSAPTHYQQETVIGGDGIVPAIMLASVAAKVLRDRLMVGFAETYPLYGFAGHKGYGTKAHLEALRTHGLCAIHRRSFIHLAS